jgi:hypothetical protein
VVTPTAYEPLISRIQQNASLAEIVLTRGEGDAGLRHLGGVRAAFVRRSCLFVNIYLELLLQSAHGSFF